MKRKILSLVLTMCMIASLLPAMSSPAAAIKYSIWNGVIPAAIVDCSFGGGDGTETVPYLINNASDLAQLSANVNGGINYSGKYFLMTSNIYLNDTSAWKSWDGLTAPSNAWTPIGNSAYPFEGTFDGGGHTVSGIYISRNADYQGLFGKISVGALKNIGVVDSYISGNDYVGGIVGHNESSTISCCYNTGSVTGIGNRVGGVTGAGSSSTVTGCYNTGSVNGNYYVGGVIGNNFTSTVTGCYNTGSVNGTGSYVGGVIGNNSTSTVTSCYNTGSLKGTSYVGGIAGYNNDSSTISSSTISNCYNTGCVNGTSYVGGIAAFNSNSTVAGCYNTGSVNGTGDYVGGIASYNNNSSVISYCYNTGSVSGTSVVGGVTGYNSSSTVTGCYYDSQLCPVGGIGGIDEEGYAEGELTAAMTSGVIGSSLGDAFYGFSLDNWIFTAGLYPSLKSSNSVSAATNAVEANGITATASFGSSPYLEGTEATVTIALSGTAVAAGTHTIGLTSSADAGTITAPTTVTKTVTVADAPTDSFEFTFTMPASAVDDLVVTHTFELVQSTAPTADDTTVAKTTTAQASVDFTLDTALTGIWNVYNASTAGSIVTGVTASVSDTTLTLTHASNIPAGTNYVSVTETGKTESTRLALTILDVPTYAVSAATNSVEVNGITATASFGSSPYLEGITATVTITLSGTSAEAGTHTIGLTSASDAGTITAPTTVTKTVAASDTPTDTFVFTFTMPANAVDDLVVTHTFEQQSSYIYIPSILGSSVIVNGNSQMVGVAASSNVNGQTVKTITVDADKLETLLASEDNGALVIIPITGNFNSASGILTGQSVKTMGINETILEIQTDLGSYTLPASEIDIDMVATLFGQDVPLSDIAVEITIAAPSDDTVTVVENAALNGGFTLVVPAVEYTISCSYNGKTVHVRSFSGYVERTIAIPDGIDPAQITTALVVDSDGVTRHVPTQVIEKDGKYFAVINSRTNSTYALIQNTVEFGDVEAHWAKDAINDMGSRMIVSGVGNNNYAPDRAITRAEFSAIVIRALGLDTQMGENTFSDVSESDWYCGYVEAAVFYGLFTGYGDGRFAPNDNITREQAMAVIARAMAITELSPDLTDEQIADLLSAFTDSDDAFGWASADIAACLETGIVNGRSSSLIAPKEPITRAEVSVIIQRLLQHSDLI